MALKAPYLLDFRHKKRRPWTSLDVWVVGRGNLNRVAIILIMLIFVG